MGDMVFSFWRIVAFLLAKKSLGACLATSYHLVVVKCCLLWLCCFPRSY